MTTDPYAPPQADLTKAERKLSVPRAIRWMTWCGVGAAATSSGLTLFDLLRYFDAMRTLDARVLAPVFLAYSTCAVLVFAGLGYGVYRGSRTCAVLGLVTCLLTYGIGLMLSRHAQALVWAIACATLAGYILGVIGTFYSHAWRASRRAAMAV